MSQITAIQKAEDFTKEQLDLITRTIAKNATPDELKLFLYRSKQLGLDPLKPGQIYFIKYNPSSPGTIVVGIEGFRAKAGRSGKLSGINRGVIRDEKGKCVGAYAEVYRSDWKHPAREEVSLAEYDTQRGNWKTMPETMIKKVAEAAALRMAFPDDLGGVYIQDEMDQAEKNSGKILPPREPEPGNGIIHQGDMCPSHLDPRIGGRTYDQCDPAVLMEVVAKVEKKYEGKVMPAKAVEFVEKASKVIGDWENGVGKDANDENFEKF